ncbi:MAG: hypothetical protein HYX72_11975 [Acidobacteria bacterium]|nr:hypothetical protein [Acidobacteriota bacterium]
MDPSTCSHNRNPSRSLSAILLICITLVLFQAALLSAEPQGTAGKSEAKSAGKEAKNADAEPVPRISLSEITGGPGASLMVPLYYTPDPKQPLRSIAAEIDYVGNNLKFRKASRGVMPEEVGVDIKANVTENPPDPKTGISRSKLHVSIALTDKNPQQGLPEGMLAVLMFQLTMDAKPFTIKLTPTVVAAEDLRTPPRTVANVNTVPGTVTVEIPDLLPEATCFFFSH